jgi:thermostable 8-oxoguanine DNA glycosylase
MLMIQIDNQDGRRYDVQRIHHVDERCSSHQEIYLSLIKRIGQKEASHFQFTRTMA